MHCLKSALAAILCTAAMGAVAGEAPSSHGNGPEGWVPNGIPRLDHVFVIMLENHGFHQVVNNPTMPFINSLISDKNVSFATNYFAVGHPQPHQLFGNRGRFELSRAQRQLARLA